MGDAACNQGGEKHRHVFISRVVDVGCRTEEAQAEEWSTLEGALGALAGATGLLN